MIPLRDDPFRQVESLAKQFDSMVNSEFSPISLQTNTFTVDVAELDDEIVVTADAPGYDRDDLSITVGNNEKFLILEGERSHDKIENEESEIVVNEREYQTLRRRIPLPTRIKGDEATAEYSNGVVTITLPKKTVTDKEDTIEIDIEEE
jgi:HSP20 family protein